MKTLLKILLVTTLAFSAGINWYQNRNVRVNASFLRTTFSGGNSVGATVTKQPENVFFTRLQLSF
jgi:phosphate-selective porin